MWWFLRWHSGGIKGLCHMYFAALGSATSPNSVPVSKPTSLSPPWSLTFGQGETVLRDSLILVLCVKKKQATLRSSGLYRVFILTICFLPSSDTYAVRDALFVCTLTKYELAGQWVFNFVICPLFADSVREREKKGTFLRKQFTFHLGDAHRDEGITN